MPPLRILVNGEPRAIEGVPASMTVLDWLRGPAHLTGTKEGCAEGDCGACTVVVARREDGETRYRAVNSCLMSLGQLDGAALITVEGVAGADGSLHPVQQALVETAGTQCGFCTPGFVMSMFAFQQGGEAAADNTIHEMLAGNLCRCTGYRPIVEAVRRVAGGPAAAPAAADRLDEAASVDSYEGGGRRFLAPRTLGELVELRAAHPDAMLLAGGTDLGLRFSKDRLSPPLIIWTGQVAELSRIEESPRAISFGAAVTYAQAQDALDAAFPAFGDLMRRLGSRQIRNLGTFAGNLGTASPIGDTLACLMALGAEVELASTAGRRTLAVEDFIQGYRKTALATGEVIAAIRVPRLQSGQDLRIYKLSKRFDQDISTVIGAFVSEVEGGVMRRLSAVYGGMAAKAARARHVEAALTGKPWTAETLAGIDAAVAADFQPMTDWRGSAAYRLRAAANLLRRLQVETTGAVPAHLEAL